MGAYDCISQLALLVFQFSIVIFLMNPLVSIVVLSYNKRPYTRACVASMAASTYRPLELVVVDNGSRDETLETLDQMQPLLRDAGVGMRILANDHNLGAPAGRNQGIAAAKGDYIGWCDNDVVVRDRNWIEGLIEALASDPRIGIVSPKLLFPPPLGLIEFAGCAVSRKGRVGYLGRGAPADDPRFNHPREVQAVISACVLLPRAAIEAAGPMDEGYFPVQFEDVDYCYRLKGLNFRCFYWPLVSMYHFENITTDGSPDINFDYVTIRNALRFRDRWQHVFQHEEGPPETEVIWQELRRPRIPERGEE